MARIPLTGGYYRLPVIAANAQRCVNLMPEMMPRQNQPPVPVYHKLRPGMVDLETDTTVGAVRGVYRATNGALYAVVNNVVYFVDTDFSVLNMGNIDPGDTPVSMSDNGTTVVLVDGTSKGYTWQLGGSTISAIIDAAFYGANRVCYLDGWFIFNRPATNQFYLSPNYWDGVEAFDPLYIASKTGGPDNIQSIAVMHGELWLIGALTTEVWYNSGDLDFPFARQPGVLVEHGMLRGWSAIEVDVFVFFLSRDTEGQCIVVRSEGYQVVRVSNHAIETEFSRYEVVNDAIGMVFQQDGHTIYLLVFPTADKTWAYDITTGEWHEWMWTDPATGGEHRHRINCVAHAYNRQIMGDWENGGLYALDPDSFTDAGDPIVRIRDFPHLVKDGNRLSYTSFIADMDVGNMPSTGVGEEREVLLTWSDGRGAAMGNSVPQVWGSAGVYDQSIIWRRLGMARDRVFRVSWSFPYRTGLLGAFIEAEAADE